MESEQHHEGEPEAEAAPTGPKARSGGGLIGQVAKLVGKTVGLAQFTGAKTADGIFATGRRAGKLVHVPRKLGSLVAFVTDEQEKVDVQSEIERLTRRVAELYSRIGERICHSPLFNRSLLCMDPQLEALVCTVRDLEAEVHDLQYKEQLAYEQSRSPKDEVPESAVKTEPQGGGDSQATEPSASGPSPAPEEGTAPPSGT